MTINKKILGNNISRIRKRANMSQQALAAALGAKDQSTVSSWERGVNAIPWPTLEKLAEILEVPLDKLTEGAQIETESVNNVRPVSEDQLRQVLNELLASHPALKYITALGEQILARVETPPANTWNTGKLRPAVRTTGENLLSSRLELFGLQVDIPPPPPGLNKDERARWQRNTEVLERWTGTNTARESFPAGTVPGWAVRRFLTETVEMYNGGTPSDVSGLLWSIIEEGPK